MMSSVRTSLDKDAAGKSPALESFGSRGRTLLGFINLARASRAVLVPLCGILTVCLVFYHQVADGDGYDQILEILARERWSGTGHFLSYDGLPSFNDGHLIYDLTYSFFRLVRVDPYLSAGCVSIIVRAAGFCGFYLAARRLLDFRPGWATLAAVGFILGSSTFMQASPAQLVSVAFAPVIAVQLHGMAEALRTKHRARAIACGTPAACLYAVWLLTAVHIACVFALFLAVAFLAYFALTRRAGLRAAFEFARRNGAARTPRYPIS